jgi:FMN phosphatase YigB (HAD superfamily)
MKELKPIHIFDMNGTLVGKDLGRACETYAREKVFSPIFETLLNLSESEWQERFPEAAEKNLPREIVANRVIDIVANPPKFTAARHAYYDIIEGAIRQKKIDVGLNPDVLEENSALSLLKKNGIATFLFSRGTVSIMEALLEGIDLKDKFDLYDSTIPYGNKKVAETYLALRKHLEEKGYEIQAFYEDEIAPLTEIYKAGKELELELGRFPFRLFWINREKEPRDTINAPEGFWDHIEMRENLLFNPL